MKMIIRILSLILALLLSSGTVSAESIDYSMLSTEDLHIMLDAIRNELLIREIHAGEETILLEQDGILVFLNGTVEFNHNKSGTDYLTLGVVVINNTDKQISIRNRDGCAHVNGWELTCGGVDKVDPGKKKSDEFLFNLTKAKISSLEEIDEIEFEIFVYEGTNKKDTIAQGDPVFVHLK